MIKKILSEIKKNFQSDILKIGFRRNVKFGSGSIILGENRFGGKNFLDKDSCVIDSELGYASYVGHNTILKRTVVGKFTCIGPNVSIVAGMHPTSTFVSIHPAFYSLKKQSGFCFVDRQLFDDECYVDDKNHYVLIGNDVWIGDSVKIMAGVSIGDGAVVAAGAIVNKDVPPYAIVGSIPAKIIRYRFTEEEREFLMELKWWDKDEAWIKEHAAYFEDIEKLIDIIKKEEK